MFKKTTFGLYVAVFTCAQSLSVGAVSAADLISADYSDCSCVTSPVSSGYGVGSITSSVGEVMLNNAQAASGSPIPGNADIMIGVGTAQYSVGVSCAGTAGANTSISVSQPNGPAGDICVRVTSLGAVPVVASAPPTGLAVIAGIAGVGGAFYLLNDNDGKKRTPSSP